MTPPAPGGGPRGGTSWADARRTARAAVRPPRPVRLPLDGALGTTLAAPLEALADLPSFDTSAMDGWAVAGPGPWRITGGALLAGHGDGTPLEDGHAVPIATGAPLPPGATGVLRTEHGLPTGTGVLRVRPPHRTPPPGLDVRPRGQECRTGELLLPSGTPVTPPVLALAAAAGHDSLPVLPRPRATVLVLGDELLAAGPPRDGRVRDALGPLLPPWLERLGATVPDGARRIGDTAGELREALCGGPADLFVTTGGTASGPADFVHPVLAALGARVLVDGVAVRPGHPMLLAVLPDGRPVLGLPGNPLAAACGVLTLVAPLLESLTGRPHHPAPTAPLAAPPPSHPHDTLLVPVTPPPTTPLPHRGPAMLRSLATAAALAVIPPGGPPPDQGVELLPLPTT